MKALLVISLMLSCVPALAQTPTVDVWAVPSVAKVRPDDPLQAHNLVWDQSTKTITIAGAKNQHVPFQVVISVPPPPDRNHPAASGFFVEVSDLVSSSGRLSRDRVKLYFEPVILCPGKSSPIGEGGFWPDPLPPLTDPFGMGAAFGMGIRNRAVWIDVVTPPDLPAGDYAGTVRVTQHGQEIARLNLRLKVYDFALPRETHLITYMGVSSNGLAAFHHVAPGSAEAKALLHSYHEFLYASRMEPWFNEPLQPQINVSGNDVTLSFDAAAYDLYMNQWNTKRVILEAAPGRLIRGARSGEISSETAQLVKSYLGQVRDYYRQNGWLDRLVLNSPIDEPNTAQEFEETRRWASLVHEAAPGVPFLATKTPVPQHPEWGTLRGFVNSFSIHGNDLNGEAIKRALREEQAKGGEMSWYISCDQAYPQPNYFIDAPAMDPVMVPWITWRYGMQGILYWEMKYWSEVKSPWIDPVTYRSGYFCSGGGVLNGEGSLLYPGSETRQYTGQANVAGPVSSIRFELLREGIEDYEYLWLLKSLGDAAFADDGAKSMVVNIGAFSRNVEELFALREKMARRIEQLAGHQR
jgi:hypothetical protein